MSDARGSRGGGLSGSGGAITGDCGGGGDPGNAEVGGACVVERKGGETGEADGERGDGGGAGK